MAHWIVAVGLNGPPQPVDRLLMAAKYDLGRADKHQPKKGLRIARTEPERLPDVRLGLLGAADVDLASADQRVSKRQVPIDRQRPFAFGNPPLHALRPA